MIQILFLQLFQLPEVKHKEDEKMKKRIALEDE